MDKLLSMSKREIGRLEVLQRLAEKRMKQRAAAEQLGVSVRHVKRLLRNYRQAGAAGLVSKRRGRPSNNQLSSEVRKLAVELVRARYPVQPPGLGADFGPTLAHREIDGSARVEIVAGERAPVAGRRWIVATAPS